MNKELPKVYEPQQVESRIYQMWEDHVHIDGSQACICEETCCGTFRCE